MTDLAVIFGSRAAEHDVSIVSGLQLLENVDKTQYNAYPVYISREGEWFIGEPLRDIKSYKRFDPNIKGLTQVILPPTPGANGLYAAKHGLSGKLQKACNMDCAILALHGMHGEDGTIQGLFELADIPYSSSSLVGSAVGMDKVVMKAVFKSMGLPVLDSVYCYRSEWRQSPDAVIARAEELGYPLYVKPANLGSSIGISRAVDRESLGRAMDIAVEYDRRILIEKGVDKPTEINCACLGFDGEALPSVCEQPGSWEEFLTFEDKYTRGSGKGMKSLTRQIPAPIPEEMTKRIQGYTADIFRMLECKGVVRIDYIIDNAAGQVYVNEINTIPGSFAFYLYEPMGMSYSQLIDKLAEYAFAAAKQKRQSRFAFDSEILTKVSGGFKTAKNK